MKRPADPALWRVVQAVAAEYGYGNRSRVLTEATRRIMDTGAWPEGQHALRAKLERLWADRAEIMGAN